MSTVLITLAWGLVSKLMTEAFVSKALVYALSSVSQSTENKLDDKMVAAVADALNVKL